jgi:hypothetical protein
VKKARLGFKNTKLNKRIKVVVGQDIITWAEAIGHKVAVDNWNKEIALGSVAVLGAAAAAGVSRSNKTAVAAGLGRYVAATGVLATNAIVDKVNNLEKAKLFLKTHLYQPFSVPPGPI